MTRLDVELYTDTPVTGMACHMARGRVTRIGYACGRVHIIGERRGKETQMAFSLEAFHAFRALAEGAVRTRVVPELEPESCSE